MLVVCHLYYAVSPHDWEVPNSIWNLRYRVWVGIAASAEAYIAEMKKGQP